jgi:hypothetical protein
MKHFTTDIAKKILANEIGVETLLVQYPEYQEEVLEEIGKLKVTTKDSNLINAIIDKYKTSAQVAHNKISNSSFNSKTIDAFLPSIIKARFALYLLEQLTIASTSKDATKRIRFNLWDGTILQKILFKKGFERKPVSLSVFKFFWKFITNKNIMPLINQKGIYCFYSKPLINKLSRIIAGRKCIEIAAGDGTLTKFLNEKGIDCIATDDYSWQHYITYSDCVEKIDAKVALQKYNPEVVICSWPVPRNTYEKHVFNTNSINTYIVIGTNNPLISGDFESYYNTNEFTMELDKELSSLILPPSNENAVYIFQRK